MFRQGKGKRLREQKGKGKRAEDGRVVLPNPTLHAALRARVALVRVLRHRHLVRRGRGLLQPLAGGAHVGTLRSRRVRRLGRCARKDGVTLRRRLVVVVVSEDRRAVHEHEARC